MTSPAVPMSDQRQKIIDSVFSRRNAAGNLDETYVSHVKIWEDAGPEGGGRKPRYILLSQTGNGGGFLHKAKLNTNGSFSVGKTWRLSELRGIQVVGPLAFNLTLSRTYRWQTENEVDQSIFLEALVQLSRRVSGEVSLQLDGFGMIKGDRNDSQSLRPARPPSPIAQPSATQAFVNHSKKLSQTLPDPELFQQVPSPQQHQPSVKPPSRSASPTSKRKGHPVQASNARPLAVQAPASLSRSHFQGHSVQPVSHSPVSKKYISSAAHPTVVKKTVREDTSDGPKREQNTRVSFFDPVHQAIIERLITGGIGAGTDLEGEEEHAITTMSIVEEMIEGYEWASYDIISRKSSRGAADMIEARLLDELMALEKANIYSFLESDDRIAQVLKYLDESVSELDNIDSLVSSYKIHLNSVADDIQHIQSQNRGLQVQTQNQRALLLEIENLLETVNVDQHSLVTLTQESLENQKGIDRLEEAAAGLYKALQAGRDTEMAATMERLQEYRTHNSQFCKRMVDFLSIMFTAQSTMLLGDNNGMKSEGPGQYQLSSHQDMEKYLGRYSGLMLYLKEMDEKSYAKLCAAYFSAASTLHGTQIKALFSLSLSHVRKVSDDGQERGFSPTIASKNITGMRRAGTLIRSPAEGRQKDKDKGELRLSQVFALVLAQLAPVIYQEDEFITDFLQINDAGLTFADYMGLDNYFRRQAARSSGLSQSTLKLVRGAMDLIFGFLPLEIKTWLDSAIDYDSIEVIGVIATVERCLSDARERGNQFLLNTFSKQLTRLKSVFDRHINRLIDDIEHTKLSSKKRQGVAHFVKQFPSYIGRVEDQLIAAEGLEIRSSVNAAYEKIVATIFESLKHMAKLSGEEEDKSQLNYHIIMIENMHHFIADISSLEIGSMQAFSRKAEATYDENLSAYIKIIIRRPFARIIDYFEGMERFVKTTAPNEILNTSMYSKSALRKVIKEYNAKDVRKHIDALFGRVGKHFAEASDKTVVEDGGIIAAGTVMVGVWKACEEEVLRITALFSKRLSQSYKESGISLEYTVADVEGAFRRHRAGQ